MNIIQINGKNFENIESISADEFLREKPIVDHVLLDCRDVSLSVLEKIVNAVRTRYICYAYAEEAQQLLLKRFGHFDLTKIWEKPNFIEQLEFMFTELTQTQGFSMMPDEAAMIVDDFPGEVERHGRYEMQVSGEFPKKTLLLDYKRLVLNWGKPIYVIPFRRFYNAVGRHHLIFDYETTGDLEVTYVITTLDKKGNILKRDEISEKEYIFDSLKNVEYKGQIYIKGSGTLRLGKVWTHKEKYGLGWFQMGDEHERTANGEPIYSYFIPGKSVKKLIVGFSGNLSELPHYERQTMAKTGFPVLLFCDLRARGGAFQLGYKLSEDYSMALIKLIDIRLTSLGLTRQDLIFAGWSMGSFPAMYYGMRMQAGHVIAAKPLLHLGDVTGNKKVIYRTEPSMISAREYLMGRCMPEDTEQLNNIIYEILQQSDVSQTSFYSFMMSNDELDRCEPFFEKLTERAKSVDLEHSTGFHADKIGDMGQWINKILDKLSDDSIKTE